MSRGTFTEIRKIPNRSSSRRHDLTFGDREHPSFTIGVGSHPGPPGEGSESRKDHLAGIEQERVGEDPSGAITDREHRMQMSRQDERGVIRRGFVRGPRIETSAS